MIPTPTQPGIRGRVRFTSRNFVFRGREAESMKAELTGLLQRSRSKLAIVKTNREEVRRRLPQGWNEAERQTWLSRWMSGRL